MMLATKITKETMMNSKEFDPPRPLNTIILVGCLALFFALYISYQARELIRGPMVQLEGPVEGIVVIDQELIVHGSAHNVSRLTLNDRPIYIDANNHFEERLVVPAGYTILTIVAEDRFKRVREQSLELLVTPQT